MEKRFYTIGMAGHIDHGKTELTRALTQVDTDRLKEEKERGVSIELGYAPFLLNNEWQVSVIDVPGHEKFIRQMIAGVAGIDLVIIVIAADEGVMPQTKEHLEILSFLGISEAVIAITKMDKVDEEFLQLVKEDISEAINGTPFENAVMVCVDSVSKKGIAELTKTIENKLAGAAIKNSSGPFRLPIDQVFSIQGQGTVVRGTVFDGAVKESETLKVLPQNKQVRVRQIQVQHERVKKAQAGQRAALNLGGIARDEIKRGDVLVGSDHFLTTRRLDVLLKTAADLKIPLKQRAPVNVHIGTAIVTGKVIFFDRNQLESDEDVLCQLELSEPVVAKRGERLIVRRPTPVETIGGGWVIDGRAEKHRFGEKTIQELTQKKDGTPEERVVDLLHERQILSEQEILRHTGLAYDKLQSLESVGKLRKITGNLFVLTDLFFEQKGRVVEQLKNYHGEFSLRAGMDKAEMMQSASVPSDVMEAVIDDLKQTGRLIQHDQYLALSDFEPSFPVEWAKRMNQIIDDLKHRKCQPETWEELAGKQNLPDKLQEDFKQYLLYEEEAYKLDDTHLIHKDAFFDAIRGLFLLTEGSPFPLKQAKDALGLSRKYLIPFLELLDRLKLTVRHGNERKWVKSTVDRYQIKS